MENMHTTDITAADIDAQLAALDNLSIEDAIEMAGAAGAEDEGDSIVIEENDDGVPEEGSLLAEIAAEITSESMQAAKQALYSEQEPGSDIEEPVQAPTPAAPKTKREGTPRARGDIAALNAECFILEVADADGDLDANKAAVLALRPTAKKIAEKFDNLFVALSAGKKPSAYTMVGFRALDEGSPLASSDMIKAMQAADYSLGTARSQAQQIQALFLVTKIATKHEGKLVLNPNSVLAAALKALAAPAEEPATETV